MIILSIVLLMFLALKGNFICIHPPTPKAVALTFFWSAVTAWEIGQRRHLSKPGVCLCGLFAFSVLAFVLVSFIFPILLKKKGKKLPDFLNTLDSKDVISFFSLIKSTSTREIVKHTTLPEDGQWSCNWAIPPGLWSLTQQVCPGWWGISSVFTG